MRCLVSGFVVTFYFSFWCYTRLSRQSALYGFVMRIHYNAAPFHASRGFTNFSGFILIDVYQQLHSDERVSYKSPLCCS